VPSNEIYRSPDPNLEEDIEPKSSLAVRILAITSSILLGIIALFRQGASANSAYALGGVIGSLAPAAIIVLLFQMGPRFRNARSRWRIFMWSQFVFLTVHILVLREFLSKLE